MRILIASRAIATDNTPMAEREEGALRAAIGLATLNTQGASAGAEGAGFII
jgi:hypothetical protein